MAATRHDRLTPLAIPLGVAAVTGAVVAAAPTPVMLTAPPLTAAAASIALAVASGTRLAPLRVGWSLLAVWAALMIAVEALRALAAIEPATESIAIAVHLLAAPVGIWALSVLFRAVRAAGALVRRFLDGWLYAGTLLAVAIQFVVVPEIGAGRLTRPGTVFGFIYFAFNLTVAVVLASVAMRGSGTVRRVALLGTVAVISLAASDGLRLLAELDNPTGPRPVAGLVVVAFILIASIPYLGDPAEPIARYPHRLSVTALGAPYTAALIGGGSLLTAIMAGVPLQPLPVGLIASVVFALVVRQGLTLIDNVRLVGELAERENHFRSLVLGSSDVIMVADADGVIQYASPAMERIFGYLPSEVVNTRLIDLVHPQDAAKARTTVGTFLHSDAPLAAVEARLRNAAGAWRHTESTLSRDEDRLIINVRDVSDRVALRRELERLALHDTLTGLPNRALLTDRLIVSLAGPGRDVASGDVGVIFLDLDGLKEVNDTSGHEAGDEVLVEAARRIVEVVGQSDLVARFGGDEFVVVLDVDATKSSVLQTARAIVSALDRPFVVAGRQVDLSASAGVAFADDGEDVPEILRAADLAMYRAKARGRGQIEVFRPELRAAASSRAELTSRLVRALEERAFALQYQPVIDLPEGRVVALEALIRWRSDSGMLLTPIELIRQAEDSGRIAELGRWVVQESLTQAGRWRSEGRDFELAVNLSVAQVDDPELVDVIAAALRDNNVPPQQLTLEITESLLLKRVEEAVARLSALRALGVRVVLDDFGTGYSSLAYLSRLPVDGLKLDASFVRRLGGDAAAKAVATAVVRLGHDLGLVITAEGVESAVQAEALRAMGCHRAQGFYYSGPLDVAAASEIVARRAPLLGRPASFEARTVVSKSETGLTPA